MTKKEYLGQAYRIDQRINSKIEQIASLRILALPVARIANAWSQAMVRNEGETPHASFLVTR